MISLVDKRYLYECVCVLFYEVMFVLEEEEKAREGMRERDCYMDEFSMNISNRRVEDFEIRRI